MPDDETGWHLLNLIMFNEQCVVHCSKHFNMLIWSHLILTTVWLLIIFYRLGNWTTKRFISCSRLSSCYSNPWGFLAGSVVKNLPVIRRCRRCHGFDPWVGKIPWRRTWQPTPVFLPGKSHGQSSLVGYTVHGVAKSQMWMSMNMSIKFILPGCCCC